MRTRSVVVAVLLLVAGACADDPSVEGAPSSGGVTSTDTTARDAAPAAPEATTSTVARTGRTIIVGGTDAVPDTTMQPSSGRPSPRRSNPLAGGPGSGAGHLLRPSGASRLVLQVVTQPGAAPRRATSDRSVQVLREASGKPVQIAAGTVDEVRDVWSGADLRSAADAATLRVPEDTAVIRVLFVHGRSAAGEDVLGVATAADVAAIFVDRVEAAATALVSPAAIERAVTTHELGHLLGLVDLFLDTGRADPEHPGHSSNRRSVMFWAVESTLITDLLAGGPPQDFDDQDRADLAAIRRG